MGRKTGKVGLMPTNPRRDGLLSFPLSRPILFSHLIVCVFLWMDYENAILITQRFDNDNISRWVLIKKKKRSRIFYFSTIKHSQASPTSAYSMFLEEFTDGQQYGFESFWSCVPLCQYFTIISRVCGVKSRPSPTDCWDGFNNPRRPWLGTVDVWAG